MGRDELYITVNHACIWNKAKSVYKGAVHDESILHKYVTIEFCGEEGVDAGALRNDFFEETLRQANDSYFEGQDERRIPKCHCGAETELEMVGCMTGHSVLQRGPGLPCLHPALVHYMLTKEVDFESNSVNESILPTKDDIPMNARAAKVSEPKIL